MSSKPKNHSFYETEMIKSDASFYLDLTNILNKNHISNIIFGLLPYISLFIKETYDHSQSNMPDFYQIAKRKHEQFIFSARLSAKLFDESLRSFTEISQEIDWIVEHHCTEMTRHHRGIFFWRKRFQPDLGLYLFDGHIYATTHIASFNSGLVRKNLTSNTQEFPPLTGTLSKEIGYDIGEYIGLLQKYLTSNSEPPVQSFFGYPFDETSFAFKDVFAKKYYPGIFNGTRALQINFYLLTFLAAVNFLRFIFGSLVISTPDTFLKIKYITLYHLIASAKNLQDTYYSSGILTERTKKLLRDITSNKDSKFLAASNKSQFRNTLVHYKIREVPLENLDSSLKMWGLIEHFFKGMSFFDFNSLLDIRINQIAELLEEYLVVPPSPAK